MQKKRKEKLQQMQIQQLQQQKATLFAAAGKRKNDNENKEISGFDTPTPDMQQTNNTANNHAKIPLAAIPLQILQDVPWFASVWNGKKLSELESTPSISRIHTHTYTEWHKKNGNFWKTQHKLKKSKEKNYWQKLNHYNLPFKRQ